jgi:amino-acid N-acetyltransferase
MELRKATSEDVSAIYRLIQKSRKNGKILRRSRADLKKAIPFFWVAEEEGKVVGCCACEIYNKKLAEVRSLAVEAERQRKGIASALVAQCIREAGKRGIYELLVITDRQNLFKKRGFSEQLHGQKALFLRP